MSVLLVTSAENLAEKFVALNPELEYSAIVTDDVESVKRFLAQIGLSKNFICSMDDLMKCIEYLWYDYVVCVDEGWGQVSLVNMVRGYNIPLNKVIYLWALNTHLHFFVERSLRYFKEHAQEFEMFATGMSTVECGIDITKFKRKTFNLGVASQDLYYNFQMAKFAISCGGGDNRFRYALMGFTSYIFHWDLSSAQHLQGLILRNFIPFKDVHNFFVPANLYEKFFRKEWLEKKIPLNTVNPNNPHECKPGWRMTKEMIDSNRGIETWMGKYYLKTRDENIKILDDYLTLCEENNIRPVMFTVPVTEKFRMLFNKQILEEFYVLIEQALNKHPNARFFDGWKLPGFDYLDFSDHHHLNIYGSAKFSTCLNDFIEQLDNGG